MSPTDRKKIRDFGIAFAVVGAAYGAWSLYRKHPGRAEVAAAVGGLFLLGGFLAPGVMRHLYKGWMLFGHALGWINTRILLGVIFYLGFTPGGLFCRLLGRDALARRLEPGRASYWEDADPAGNEPERMRRLF